MRDLRLGVFDVLIGVNLLREGLDFPEVSLVAILDADKEGFLRNERSLVQTIGRAARNVNGLAIMYADKITPSMQVTIDETYRRRAAQEEYNAKHGLVPVALVKSKESIMRTSQAAKNEHRYEIEHGLTKAAEPKATYHTKADFEKAIRETRKKMELAAKSLDFIEAARLRDLLIDLENEAKKARQ
jgi:excinuclease ABC subunit B